MCGIMAARENNVAADVERRGQWTGTVVVKRGQSLHRVGATTSDALPEGTVPPSDIRACDARNLKVAACDELRQIRTIAVVIESCQTSDPSARSAGQRPPRLSVPTRNVVDRRGARGVEVPPYIQECRLGTIAVRVERPHRPREGVQSASERTPDTAVPFRNSTRRRAAGIEEVPGGIERWPGSVIEFH